ncbi:Leucine-rich repeat-containing protein 45 [Halocaridina rubra]|uniref:Leucine-rich repeat-containing protein 45 n=1 Tax=Halocaridina rubra TaxID=373956 RepID=A0AAN8WM07_HALRR
MASTSELYKQLSRKYNIEVQDCVKDALDQGDIWDLSNHTLSVGSCAVLGKIMQISSNITKASFEDCLLEEDGIKSILLGLCGNASFKTVSLKGNNIQGNATHALAKMLRHNSALTRLSLEWNSLGVCSESFAAFCEALGSNSTLQYLDIRSNQLGADAAVKLGQALMRNTCLLVLDVRWNSLGGSGGKALLESLRHNKSLTKLSLIGNNISNDVIGAIDNQIAENCRTEAMSREYTSRTEILHHQLEQHERYSSQQIERLEKSLSKTDLALNKTIKDSTFHVGQLEEELRSRKLEYEALEAKLKLVSSALKLSQERIYALEQRNSSLDDELQTCQKEAQIQSNKDKEVLESAKLESNQEIRSLQAVITKLEAQVGELEFRCGNQKAQILDLKESVCSLQSEVKGVRIECDDLVTAETGRYKETVRNLEQHHNAELQRVRNEHQQLEGELRERIANMDTRRNEAEGEVARLRVQLSTEHTTSQAQLIALKHRLKAEHAAVVRGLEERLNALEENRNDAEDRLRSQITANTALTAANAKLNTQIHAINNQLTELQAEVNGKALEVKAAETRVRAEVKEQLEELKREREQTAQLNETIMKLKRTISEKHIEYDSKVHSLEDELRRVKDHVKRKEEELQKAQEDEERRVGMLHSAFVSYFNTSSPTKTGHATGK